MRHPTAWQLTVPVVGALLLAGCTALPARAPSASASATVAVGDTAEPVWSVSTTVMGQPVVKDDVLVAYAAATDTHTLAIVAWDAKSGKELWRHDAAPGNNVAVGVHMDPSLTEVGGRSVVTYLVGDAASSGTLVAVADVKTGAETRFGPAAWASGRPSDCADSKGVCLEGMFAGETTTHQIRLDEGSSTLVTDTTGAGGAEEPLPNNARWLGANVFSTNDRGTPAEQLGYSAGGTVKWTRPYQDVFGPYSSSDGGWMWDARGDLLVGSGGVSPYQADGVSLAFPDDRVVALSADTGETVWSVDGYPCNGGWGSGTVLPVCVDTGTVTYTVTGGYGGSINPSYTDHKLYVVGIDMKTGKEKWRFPGAGQEPTVPEKGLPTYAPMDGYIVAWKKDGPALVELSTGKVTSLAPDQTYLCNAGWEGSSVSLHPGGAGSGQEDYGREVLQICDKDGSATDKAPWPAFFVKATGAQVAGLYIVATDGKLAAFRL